MFDSEIHNQMKKTTCLILVLFQVVFVIGQEKKNANQLLRFQQSDIIGTRTISEYLTDDLVPEYFKYVFLNSEEKLSDDNSSLAIIDSLLSNDTVRHPFYFVLVTRTMAYADGAYAEPLGIAALEFFRTRPDEFFRYFESEIILTEIDFKNWINVISMEINIAHEGYEIQYLNTLQIEMDKYGFTYMDEILVFIDNLKSKLH